jgi:hypothetical protein
MGKDLRCALTSGRRRSGEENGSGRVTPWRPEEGCERADASTSHLRVKTIPPVLQPDPVTWPLSSAGVAPRGHNNIASSVPKGSSRPCCAIHSALGSRTHLAASDSPRNRAHGVAPHHAPVFTCRLRPATRVKPFLATDTHCAMNGCTVLDRAPARGFTRSLCYHPRWRVATVGMIVTSGRIAGWANSSGIAICWAGNTSLR